mmetsp:Transcript_4501/g.10491  ORF Transcript_4501/g.10491 Transcript_4501/m.10491 type:complete len:89 (-) Transcript_4501:436-702(-)
MDRGHVSLERSGLLPAAQMDGKMVMGIVCAACRSCRNDTTAWFILSVLTTSSTLKMRFLPGRDVESGFSILRLLNHNTDWQVVFDRWR